MGDSTARIQPGDIVRLQTGGDEMVVHSHDGELVTCIWFDVEGKACKMPFPCYELIPVSQIS
jgi:uncharacterized protein YodC (DUF2158 family)